MIRDGLQRERVLLEVERLEKLVKAGAASDIDRARLRKGELDLLCWDWEQEGRERGGLVLMPSSEPPPVVKRFVDWFTRNVDREPWNGRDSWLWAWLYWSAGQTSQDIELMPMVEDALIVAGVLDLEPMQRAA